MYNALDIASYIITSGKVTDLTHLKLQKLLYYTYGVYWKERKQRLFKDSFYAWELGPVVRTVYNEYRNCGSDTITEPANANARALGDESAVINTVLDVFGNKTAAELVTLTHLTDPWISAFKDPMNDEIYPDAIHEYFEKAI
jgi:uncharacterized phage-associated protein